MIFQRMDNKGFSILQVLIAVGLAGALSVYLMKLNSEQLKVSETAKTNHIYQTFTEEIKSVLSKTSVCFNSFKEIDYDGETGELERIVGKNKKVYFRAGRVIEKRILIKSMKLGKFLADDPDEVSVGAADLIIELERVKNIYGGKKLIKKIPMNLLVDDEFKILNCGTLSSGVNFEPLSLDNMLKVIDSKPLEKVHPKVEALDNNNPDKEETIEKEIEENTPEKNTSSESISSEELKQIKNIKGLENIKIEEIKKTIEGNPMLQQMLKQVQYMKKYQQQIDKNMEE